MEIIIIGMYQRHIQKIDILQHIMNCGLQEVLLKVQKRIAIGEE